MAVILAIESSGVVCSAALLRDGVCVAERIDMEGRRHAQLLPRFVEDLISVTQEKGLCVDAVALSCGPGSYTGLRIGSSTAKGLCYGWGVPLIAIPTLEVMADVLRGRGGVDDGVLLCPMVDARRMEVFAGVFDGDLNVVRETVAVVVDEGSFSDVLSGHKVVFFGDGAEKCKGVLKGENVLFADGIYASAAGMASLAERFYSEGRFADVASFEPFYLKQFVATVPRPLI